MKRSRKSKIPSVIGLGTGRCGTKSLKAMLESWGFDITHERTPHLSWEGDDNIYKKITELESGKSDVAFYYLNYTTTLISNIPEIKMVCLQRNKEDTIDSFIRKLDGRNHFIDQGSDPMDRCFPDYNEGSVRRALARYWDEYYVNAEAYMQEYPDNFRIFPLETLNTNPISIEEFING